MKSLIERHQNAYYAAAGRPLGSSVGTEPRDR
jgi:hypothetical protein